MSTLLTYLMPTVARPHLEHSLASCLATGASVHVGPDGRHAQEALLGVLQRHDWMRDRTFVYANWLTKDEPHNKHGDDIRRTLCGTAPSGWVAMMDDDTLALPYVRLALERAHDDTDVLICSVHRNHMNQGWKQWPAGKPRKYNIDGHCLIVRAEVARQVPWPSVPEYASDAAWFADAAWFGALSAPELSLTFQDVRRDAPPIAFMWQ